MKKLIYLPLMVVIILTGCKGNSFMKQRYTNLGHASKHPAQAKPASEEKHLVNSDTKAQSALVASAGEPADKNNILLAKPGAYNLFEKQPDQDLNSSTIPANLAKPSIEKTGSGKTVVKHVKQLKEKAAARKGIIGAALSLVIFIIVVVVIVSLVLVVVIV